MKLNTVNLGLGGGTLLQIANRSSHQMMSYLIDTPNGNVIMIDGGYCCNEDSNNLYKLLSDRGKCVDYWFITHAHSDHLGALLNLLEMDNFDIDIKHLCFHFPCREWLLKMEGAQINERFFNAVNKHKITVVTPNAGDCFECGGVAVNVLNEPRNYQSYPSINPTSIILLVKFPANKVLFLGDFDVFGQDDYVKNFDVSKLKCDIVQMAHHGQQGVDRAFYEYIEPKICLYTAPKWLWENNCYMCDNPETAGKGPFTIMETRQWMKEIGRKADYTIADGDYMFR